MKPTVTSKSEIERALNSQGITVTWEEFPYEIPESIPGKTKDERFKWVWDCFRKFLLCERHESITRNPKYRHQYPELEEIVSRENDDDSCYRNWIGYNSYLLDGFFDEIDGLPDTGICLDRYIIDLSIGIGFTLIRIGSSHTDDIREFIEHLWCIDSTLARIDRRSNYKNLPEEIIDIGRRDLRIYCTQAHRAIVALSVKDFGLIGKKGNNGGRMSGDYVKDKLAAYGASIKGKSEKELAKIKLEQIVKATGLPKTTVAVSPLWKHIAAIKKKHKRASVGAMSKGIEESYGEKEEGEIGYCGNRRKAKPTDHSGKDD